MRSLRLYQSTRRCPKSSDTYVPCWCTRVLCNPLRVVPSRFSDYTTSPRHHDFQSNRCGRGLPIDDAQEVHKLRRDYPHFAPRLETAATDQVKQIRDKLTGRCDIQLPPWYTMPTSDDQIDKQQSGQSDGSYNDTKSDARKSVAVLKCRCYWLATLRSGCSAGVNMGVHRMHSRVCVCARRIVCV